MPRPEDGQVTSLRPAEAPSGTPAISRKCRSRSLRNSAARPGSIWIVRVPRALFGFLTLRSIAILSSSRTLISSTFREIEMVQASKSMSTHRSCELFAFAHSGNAATATIG